MSNDHFNYAREMELIMMWDKRMTRAGIRLGLSPFPIDYRLTTDDGVTQTLPYVGMPNDYVHWSKGKEAEKNRRRAMAGTSMRWCSIPTRLSSISPRPTRCRCSST